MSMKPRKYRRFILTGHRWKVFREARGHAVPDRAMKRYYYLRRHFGPDFRNGVPQGSRGKHPERKPKEKK